MASVPTMTPKTQSTCGVGPIYRTTVTPVVTQIVGTVGTVGRAESPVQPGVVLPILRRYVE